MENQTNSRIRLNATGVRYIYYKNKPAGDNTRSFSNNMLPIKKQVGTGVCLIIITIGNHTISKPVVIL